MENTPDLLSEEVELIGKITVIPNILDVICQSTGMGFAAVARVTSEKWIACAVKDDINFGLKPGGELKLETTICNEIRQSCIEVVIDNVPEDEIFSGHHTPAMYGFKSYISVPIINKNGEFFGTLCAIDPNPAELNNPKIRGMFHLFADLIAFHMDAIEKMYRSEKELIEERETAVLREQFIAVLGHDLRNPLNSVMNIAKILLRSPDEERVEKLAHILQDSSFRMRALIDNILDFARGRLGDGITLEKSHQHLKNNIQMVVDELAIANPDADIQIQYDLDSPVYCDGGRFEQLLSNLLSNAISYGHKDKPILVKAKKEGDELLLSVVNSSEKIPDEVLYQLFKPFVRGENKSKNNGLGLGLYISSEIAKAHGGAMAVNSDEQTTSFVFRMPT
ncbi:MAG TPA: GAF domain-containing sensor histidine kinase [Pelobium sp.]|nr:GAF domain-containing sensor histidine kinase [Pelobium sp.]